MRGWRLQLKSDKSIEDLAWMFGPVLQGWMNYYCRFHRSAFRAVAERINQALVRWAMRKFKRFTRSSPSCDALGRTNRTSSTGIVPALACRLRVIGWDNGSRMS